ncbi:MAG: CinA family protein [Candidatus Aegiribacteria sp.]|nr:CinA family protein [Candidatus Aegiribacteria sp.]
MMLPLVCFQRLSSLLEVNSMELSDRNLVKEIGAVLQQNGQTLSVAESCTGGFVGMLLTSEPGSSEWFAGGVIAYSDRVKTDLLGVPSEMIQEYGAVSNEVVTAMAGGIRRLTGTDYSLSVSGIAGPTGGTPEKPVGTVCMAVDSDESCTTVMKHFSSFHSREVVRKTSASYLLTMLYSRLREDGK